MQIFWINIHQFMTDPALFLSLFPHATNFCKDYVCFEDVVLHLIGNALCNYGKSLYPFVQCSTLQYNISHSGYIAVCAIDNNPVGIDIEQILSPTVDISPFFHTAEQIYLSQFSSENRDREFYRLWTRKESLYKAQHLHDMNLLQLECMITSSGNLQEHFDDWILEELPICPEKYVAVLCHQKSDTPIVYNVSIDDLLQFIKNSEKPFQT